MPESDGGPPGDGGLRDGEAGDDRVRAASVRVRKPALRRGAGSLPGRDGADRRPDHNFDGGSCAKCAKAKSSTVGIEDNAVNVNSTLGRTYYFRAALKFGSNAPTANLTFLKVFAASNIELVFTTAKQVDLWNNFKAGNVLEAVIKPEANRYYLFELKVLVAAAGNGTIALRIYSDAGVTIYESGDQSVEIGNTKITFWEAGRFLEEETGVDVYVSHLALNNSTGEKQNGSGPGTPRSRCSGRSATKRGPAGSPAARRPKKNCGKRSTTRRRKAKRWAPRRTSPRSKTPTTTPPTPTRPTSGPTPKRGSAAATRSAW